MGKLIEFRNTNFAYNVTHAFKDFNLEIMEEDIVTLVGPGGSGKTTLLKILKKSLPNNSVYYNGVPIATYNTEELKKNLVVIFDYPFEVATVKGELRRFISTLNINTDEIDLRLKELDKYFKIERFLDLDPRTLSNEEQYLIKILRYLIIKPKFIAIDNILSNIQEVYIKKFFDYIKKNKMTLLNVTNDLNLALYGNKLCVLEDFTLILEGNPLSVLKTDTLLKRLGFKLPFAVEMSIELMHYDILNKVYTDKEKLVNNLWK